MKMDLSEKIKLLECMKQFRETSSYDCNDIAEKLIELSNLEDDGMLRPDLAEALHQIKAIAQNPYNSDYYRIFYNILLVITGFEFY